MIEFRAAEGSGTDQNLSAIEVSEIVCQLYYIKVKMSYKQATN